jgi:hypothetical protein
MTPTHDLATLIQRERERDIRSARFAGLTARVGACCDPRRLDRLASLLRHTQSCPEGAR